LGVLAAVALPKFVDLKSDAQLAAMQGVAGGAASAASVNYAGCSIATHASAPLKCSVVNTCDSVKQALTGSTWPTGYSTVATSGTELGTTNASNGVPNTCTLSLSGYTPATPVTFQVIGAGNP
jgi:MSHA pilin protein MshA